MIGDLLANRMQKIIRKNMDKGRIKTEDINNTIEELRICLLEADVNQIVVNDLLDVVASKAQGQILTTGLKPSQMMIKILHTEILRILGGKTTDLNLNSRPAIILMVGLQGSGKTTSCGKIAHLIQKQNSKKPLLVACDIYRPGAIEQLKIVGEGIGVPVFQNGTANPVSTAQKALKLAKREKHDLIIIDTAGRLQINDELMGELIQIRNKVSPHEILLVVDGMVGQDIINQAKTFNDKLKLTGVVVTKLDGDTRGGAALSIRYLTGLPIKFIGTGEQVKNLQIFHPDRMANRIMGMGDLKTFFETVNESMDNRTIKTTMTRMMRGQFDLQDLLNQLKQMSKAGSLQKIARLMPGVNNISAEKISNAERRLHSAEILITSMTARERREIRLLRQISRKNRILKGSGRTEKEYNELINNYNKSKKQVDMIAKSIKQGKMPNIPSMGGF